MYLIIFLFLGFWMLTEEVVYPVSALAMDNSLSFSVQIFPFSKVGGFSGLVAMSTAVFRRYKLGTTDMGGCLVAATFLVLIGRYH